MNVKDGRRLCCRVDGHDLRAATKLAGNSEGFGALSLYRLFGQGFDGGAKGFDCGKMVNILR